MPVSLLLSAMSLLIALGTPPAAPSRGAAARPARRIASTSPFEISDHELDLPLGVGRSKRLRTVADIRRISIASPSIINVILATPREILVLGKGPGATDLTVWMGDAPGTPVRVVVHVNRLAEPPLTRQR